MAQAWISKIKTAGIKRLGISLLIVFMIILPIVFNNPYYLHIIIMTEMNAVLAMTFILLLRTGLINMAIAPLWGVGAYVSTVLVMKMGLSFWIALPSAAIGTAIVGLGVGYLTVRTPGFGFLILTSVVGMVFGVACGNIPYIGGFHGIQHIPPPDSIKLPFLTIDFTSKLEFYYLMLFLTLVVVLVLWAFYAAWIGRAWMAIGLNPNLAASIGVNVFKYRLIAFVLSSAVIGLMGSFYASYLGAIQPTTFGMFKTIYSQIYAILRGIDFAFLGPLLGSMVMNFVPELLRVTQDIDPILTGLMLVLLVLFLPGGILSLIKRTKNVDSPLVRIFKSSLGKFAPKSVKENVTGTKTQ